MFKNDGIEGRGVMEIDDNIKYEGEFKGSLMEGYGVMTYANGTKYDGYFKSDKMCGLGSLYLFDGRKIEGKWENDQFIDGGFYDIEDNLINKTLEEIQVMVKIRLQPY